MTHAVRSTSVHYRSVYHEKEQRALFTSLTQQRAHRKASIESVTPDMQQSLPIFPATDRRGRINL